MGGLHIEMAALRVLGRWLDGSGWVDVLVQADITTQGRVEAMLKAAHVKRARYAHEVIYPLNLLLLVLKYFITSIYQMVSCYLSNGGYTIYPSERCLFTFCSR